MSSYVVSSYVMSLKVISHDTDLEPVLDPAGVVAAVAGGGLNDDVGDGGEVHVGSADVRQTLLTLGTVHVVTAAYITHYYCSLVSDAE